MKTVAGVFRYSESAKDAALSLRNAGFTQEQVSLLYPDSPPQAIQAVEETEPEQHGVRGAIGGVVGGALGITAGFELGVAVTALLPGGGVILAIGIAAAALLGVGGAVSGAILGDAADDNSSGAIPSDEAFFYEEALRQGRSLVLVLANDEAEEARAEKTLEESGAQTIDQERHDWWAELREAQATRYGADFDTDEVVYREGFESALRRECRGQQAAERAECLQWWYPNTWNTAPFERGYERGQQYWEQEIASRAMVEHIQ